MRVLGRTIDHLSPLISFISFRVVSGGRSALPRATSSGLANFCYLLFQARNRGRISPPTAQSSYFTQSKMISCQPRFVVKIIVRKGQFFNQFPCAVYFSAGILIQKSLHQCRCIIHLGYYILNFHTVPFLVVQKVSNYRGPGDKTCYEPISLCLTRIIFHQRNFGLAGFIFLYDLPIQPANLRVQTTDYTISLNNFLLNISGLRLGILQISLQLWYRFQLYHGFNSSGGQNREALRSRLYRKWGQ